MKKKKTASAFPWADSSLSYIFLIIISAILLLISALRPQIFEKPRALFTDIFHPLLITVGVPIENILIFLNDMSSFSQIQAENMMLSEENKRLREWYQTALLLESENKSLRRLLNLKVKPEYKHISARILADSGNTYVKSILVSAGAQNGVRKNASVLTGEGLVGRVVEVSEKTSRVLLLTDINSRVPVVFDETNQHAILAGTNEKTAKLIHLPDESGIPNGARLITSGYGGVYPDGLPVGRVTINQTGDVNVLLFADFERMQIVRIIAKDESIQ